MICPKCGLTRSKLDALSRRNNKTMICSPCGLDEAMFDFTLDQAVNRKKLITEVEAEILRHNEKTWLTGLPTSPIVLVSDDE